MKSFIVLSVMLAVVSARQATQNYRAPIAVHHGHHQAAHHTPSASAYHSGGAAGQQHSHAGNEIPILRSDSDIQPDGHYSYAYETGNGIRASENGLGGVSVQGNAEWTAPDGTPVQMSYVADENGYHATGSHIPTPPPIPEAILKSLEYIRTHPYHEDQHQHQQQNAYKAPTVHAGFQHNNKQQKKFRF